jgi:hypothetical protein
MKKVIFVNIVVLAIVALVTLNVYFNFQKNKLSDVFLANVEALADNENGYGWFWEKHWVNCSINGQIIITNSRGSIAVGTYVYSSELLAQIQQSSYTYTVVPPSSGQKSYCYDGWSFCSSNDCR